MPVERVSSVYDLGALEPEHQKFISFLTQSKDAIIALNDMRINVKNSDTSTFTAATLKLNEAIAQSNVTILAASKAQADLAAATKQATEANAQAATNTEKATKSTKEKTLADVQAAEAIRMQNADLKTQAQQNLATIGSLDALKASLKALTAQRSALPIDATVGSSYDQLTQKIKILTTTISAEEQKVGDFKRNVGNYTGALSILKDSLTEATAQLQKMTAAGTQNTEQGQQTAKEVSLLTELVGQQSKGFTSLAREVMNTGKALATLHGEGLGGTQAFQQLEAQFTKTKRELDEFNKSQKILTSATPQLAAMTIAAKGLAGAYAIGAGASALFADGDEKVEKELQKLVAVMTVLQGLNEVHELIMQKDAIATALFGTASEGAAISTLTFGKALAFLEANPIILALGLVVSLFVALRHEAEDTKEAIDHLNQSFEEERKAIDHVQTATSAANALRLNEMKLQGATEKQLHDQEMKDLHEQANNENDHYNEIKEQIDDLRTRRHAAKEEEKKDREAGGDAFGVQQNDLGTDAEFEKSIQALKEKAATQLALTTKLNTDADKADSDFQVQQFEKAKKAHSQTLQELKDTYNAEFDIYKVHQQALIRGYDQDIKSEKVYYLDKLVALDEYIKASEQLLYKEEQQDIANKQREAAREVQHLEEQKSGKSVEEKARINENIKIVEENLQQAILFIQATYADKANQLIHDTAEQRNKIIETGLKNDQVIYDEYAKIEQDNLDKTLERIKKGLAERQRLEEAYAKKITELSKELNDKKVEFAQKGEDVLFSIGNASYQRQLNLLTDQENQVDKKTAADLAANDATVQSEEKKAANIAIINAKAQAQKELLVQKENEIKNRQAKFERAQQVFEILIQTIKSVAKIKAEAAVLFANPFGGEALGALALAQIPWVIGSGLASVAALLATPLAKYKGGRGEGKEEFALVHGGEFIHRGNGSIEATPAVESLAHLMPTDKVYKDRATMMRELAMSGLPLSNYHVGKDGSIDKAINRMSDRIEDAVSSIKIQSTIITKDGWRHHNQRLADYDRWVNKYIKN